MGEFNMSNEKHTLENIVNLKCCKGDVVYVLTNDSPKGYEESKVSKINLIRRDNTMIPKYKVPCVFDDWGGAYREFENHDFGVTIFTNIEDIEDVIKHGKILPTKLKRMQEYCNDGVHLKIDITMDYDRMVCFEYPKLCYQCPFKSDNCGFNKNNTETLEHETLRPDTCKLKLISLTDMM